MNSLKEVKYLLPAIKIDMGGFPVKQPMPTQKVTQIDPFLLLHHARIRYYDDRPARTQGIGPHPHRGFSPVTFVIEGEIHHRDSRGNNQIAKEGEIQWMHAGMGIIHSERPSEALAKKNGIQEIIQLWINSPANSKMREPYYKYLSEKEIPLIISKDHKIINKLIAGNFKDKNGAISTESNLLILWGTAEKDSEQTLQIPADFNAMIYLIKGSIRIKGYGLVDAENLLVFEKERDEIVMSFSEYSQFILFSGAPINEKVSQNGPFVMNSQTEILEAMRDFQMGKMGVLIEDK